MLNKMVKTSPSYCRSCTYGIMNSTQKYPICDYYCRTHERRNCPVGWCDKHKYKKNARKGSDKSEHKYKKQSSS